MKLTKAALNRFIKWSSSRYNELSKAQAVKFAYDLLSGHRTDYTTAMLECGSYTPSSAMTHGGSYYVNVPEGYIANVRAHWDSDRYEWVIVEEYERLEFGEGVCQKMND
jgi:hypothetical protein